MSQPTPEQAQATRELEAAITRALAAYEADEGVLVDWVVCTTSTLMRGDGDGRTSYWWLTPDPPIPHYRLVGLLTLVSDDLRNAALRMEREE